MDSINDWWTGIHVNKKGLSILHINIRSLKKHFNELLVALHDGLKQLDVLVITEPNINYALLPLFQINGFNANIYSRLGRSGGGVLVYTRQALDAFVCNLTSTTVMTSAECVSVTLNYYNEQIYVISVYRPPKIGNQNKTIQFIDELRTLFKKIPQNSKVIFCGDININLLCRDDKHVILYENLMYEYGFIKCINDVTRREILMGQIVQSCLDHIYVRAINSNITSAVIKQKNSDHYFISAVVDWKRTPANCSAECSAAPTPVSTKRILDNNMIRHKLSNTNFDNLLSIECPTKLYNSFTKIFIDIYETSVKYQHINKSSRNKKGWISKNLKCMIKERDRLFHIWSEEPRNMLKRLNYTKYRNKCQKAINKSKNIFDKNSIYQCNKNIKKVWERINSMLGNTKKSLDNTILSNISMQGSVKDICNKFADTFSKEIYDIKHNCNKKWLERNSYVSPVDISMRWQPVTSVDIKNILNKMNINKSAGSDLVRMCDLKFVSDKISPVLAKLINLSVSKSEFPSKLKEAIIRPIHKKGSFKNIQNYRPIAVLSSLDKIIEKSVVNQLGYYLKEYNVINDCQHGFQRGKSTNTLLSKFTNEINNYLHDKKFIITIFFDFKKAFDTLQKDTLLNAMKECGVAKPLNQWFCDYLTKRSYRVKVSDTYSDSIEVHSGVPQGSGSGPVCYLMHVNSLCGVLQHCSAYMYADDLCILRAGGDITEICRLIQQDIDAVVKWSHDNGIVLNSDKTKMLLIHSPYLCLPNPPPFIYSRIFMCP